jgi:hypothetical protein
MKLNRLLRLRTIAIALCALLLTQWSLAAHACPTLKLATSAPSDSQAALSPVDNAAVAPTECAHQGQPESTLCYKHCNSDEQVTGGISVAFAAPPPALRIERALDLPQIVSPAPRLGLTHATAPPLIILYCVSLT